MTAIQINLILKRKALSEGAKIAPYETIRVIAMRKANARNVVNEVFPNGAMVNDWEWLIIGDEKEFKVVWEGDFQDLQVHYEVMQ